MWSKPKIAWPRPLLVLLTISGTSSAGAAEGLLLPTPDRGFGRELVLAQAGDPADTAASPGEITGTQPS